MKKYSLLGLLIPVLAFSQIDSKAEFSEIDNHALRAPAHAEKSYDALGKYLAEPAKNDKEKIRAIFRWITHNIAYDTKAYFSGDFSASGAPNALKDRKAVCDGYAGLFEQIAKSAQLEVAKVTGFAKGYGFSAGGRIGGRPNHAWNAVMLEGTWHLLDCTWGAGYVDEQQRYVRMLQEHYFLTPPEEFIYDHLPAEEKWQLLESPVTHAEYENLVFLRPAFFWSGLKLKSHTKATIEARKELTVTFEAAPDGLVLARLDRESREVDDTRVFTQRSGSTFEIRCSFPEEGMYALRLFAKRKNDKGPYGWALDYNVDCKEGNEEVYPRTYSSFGENECFLYTPLSGVLRESAGQEFRIRVPGAEQVAVIHGEKWTQLAKNGEEFSGTAAVGKGEIQLAAKFPDQKTFLSILTYRGK